MLCTRCGKVWAPGDVTVCSSCARAMAMSAPGGSDELRSAAPTGGVVGQMVPSGNRPALIGYYLVFVALLPYVPWARFGIRIGMGDEARVTFSGVFAVAAVVFGAMGVRRVRANPAVRGGRHAWFAIVFGGLIAIAWFCALAGFIAF